MHGRFTCPKMSEVPVSEWPDEFYETNDTLLRALNARHGFQLSAQPAMLRRWDNHDCGTQLELWSVAVYVRDLVDNEVMLMESMAPVHPTDTADDIAAEFSAEIVRFITRFMESELGGNNV